ncbi:hypothetical protein KWM_0109430 [Xanthomonas vasicola pv. musacearum NCPPB 2005]|uniref:Uncharacterized protein n=1 Tax=Xanthomonas vasicola pv. vasculorum NCPPB 890 TaxID=1184265 RepID=A0A836P1K6_XANVA|nr:hypothetical protein A11M_0119595 [Xanthomonas vasicola pv. vasculorum NCPPB 895]KFA10150.1 hypothetical protein KWM_0109430 [Xanthomonas vasicola pv. musacearum NCPPB 2005]KFA12733.1 hypothetical protein KWQ_0106815 [Xanthomonas vasicola pv. musacearum NCPPB 4380]KFA22020.1 hypothetical protein A11G_0100090 [Xanthomonas vasicola pv. musacearum NCPPB 4392]KFA24510.1 hypothetical protein KW5_0118885 [Xanthomonas vasicola pv. vasculorum NCPPB 1326]KFA25792.1 hypothetical protein KWU_0101630 [
MAPGRDHMNLRRCRQRTHNARTEWPKPPNTTTRYVIACSPPASVHSIGERTLICARVVARLAPCG